MITKGTRSSEFWLTVISLVLALVKQLWLPDLPEEAFYVVISYVLGRSFVKARARGA